MGVITRSATPFQWSDAWLLLAIGFAASQRAASLGSVIATADGIQHAVITRDELNGGIGRLERAGYITYDQDGLTVTALGLTLFRESARAGATHGKRQDAIERALSAIPWSPDRSSAQALNGESEIISTATYDLAIGRHRT
jgi:hypothetical protein